MGLSTGGADDDLITEINVTPFVDVVLVLLILFMLAAPAVYQSAIRVQLPAVVTGEEVEHVTLKLFIGADGGLQLDREKVTIEKLPELIHKALTLDSKADAVVLADRAVSHGKVMEIIDLLKAEGLRDVALGVDKSAKR